MKVNSFIRFRDEEFGTVLTVGKSKIAVVTKDSAYLLRKLIDKESFTLNGVFENYSLDVKSAHKFLSMLYDKNMLVSVDNTDKDEILATC